MTHTFFANLPTIAASTLLITLTACAPGTDMAPTTRATTTDAQSGTPSVEQAFNRFPDIPIPTQASMDDSRTLVFGSGDTWYGQLGLDASHVTNLMFDFYKQELPGFSWTEVTSVRAPVSVLTYERNGRILSIQIEKASLGVGSKITLTVSPRGGTAPVMN